MLGLHLVLMTLYHGFWLVSSKTIRLGISGTQVKSSMRMKKTKESSKWLFLGNFIPEIESKAPN
jgi:hypothetical protein